jgi:putative flippase GtrA
MSAKEKLLALAARVKEKHPTLYQFLSFAALGGVVTVVDFAVFSLCRYLIYTPYLATPFHFWLFDYGTDAGGLCAFLSFVTSFVLAQIVSFIMQRRVTFKANNNTAASAAMFTVLILFIFWVNLVLPTVTVPFFSRYLGAGLGAFLGKSLNMTLSMLIEFPVDKFIIMRRK